MAVTIILLILLIFLYTVLVAALLSRTIRKHFEKGLQTLFRRPTYTLDIFYRNLSRTLAETSDIKALLGKAAGLIGEAINSRTVSFFAYYGDSRVIVGVPKATNLPLQDAHLLDDYTRLHKIAVRTNKVSDIVVRRLLISHGVHILLALRYERITVGYLLVGPKNKGKYSLGDVKMLEMIADELAVAIQNALSVHAVKDLNDSLEQRIAFATKELRASNQQLQKLDEAKDEFISMASHQLRTPLTSIKGYISMLLEGDVGTVSGDQKQVLNQVFMSSERMVRLISDFLNVSRLQTGKFVIERRPVDLAVLVEREIDGLVSSAQSRNMSFIYKKPKNIPLIDLDENKIQQVVMNFADNAIYYSKEGDKIKILLKKAGDRVEFRVKDSGIGVPPDEQNKLFGKFFRATNARKARPDGTGVGLFLAKKVVEDHGGKIIFESIEGQGSTFGFSLPLPKRVVLKRPYR